MNSLTKRARKYQAENGWRHIYLVLGLDLGYLVDRLYLCWLSTEPSLVMPWSERRVLYLQEELSEYELTDCGISFELTTRIARRLFSVDSGNTFIGMLELENQAPLRSVSFKRSPSKQRITCHMYPPCHAQPHCVRVQDQAVLETFDVRVALDYIITAIKQTRH